MQPVLSVERQIFDRWQVKFCSERNLGQAGREPITKDIENVIWSIKYKFDEDDYDILHEADLPESLSNITCNTCNGNCYLSCGDCAGEGAGVLFCIGESGFLD